MKEASWRVSLGRPFDNCKGINTHNPFAYTHHEGVSMKPREAVGGDWNPKKVRDTLFSLSGSRPRLQAVALSHLTAFIFQSGTVQKQADAGQTDACRVIYYTDTFGRIQLLQLTVTRIYHLSHYKLKGRHVSELRRRACMYVQCRSDLFSTWKDEHVARRSLSAINYRLLMVSHFKPCNCAI